MYVLYVCIYNNIHGIYPVANGVCLIRLRYTYYLRNVG